jgi:hypothetical protein
MVFPLGQACCKAALWTGAVPDSIGRPAAEQPPALRLNDSQIRPRLSQIAASLGFDFRSVDFRRVGTHQSEYATWGVPSKKTWPSSALPAQRLTMPKSREIDMKEATKRAASEALAQMLAVTAMLVIASVIFYWR